MILRALSHQNYRLFFSGQSVSLIGTWISRVAMSWLVYRLTDSAFVLGVVGFANQIPTFFLVPFAGVLVDRWSRHRMLVMTHSLLMAHSFILAVLALTHTIQVWQIILLSILQGIIHSFEIPARQSFVSEMVGKKEDLANAIALNSSLFNATRLVGPALAGVLISALGEGMCFLLDGISYIAVIVSLLSMTIIPRPIKNIKTNVFQGIKEGIDFAFGFAPVRAILLLVALASLTGISYTVLLPVIARDVLHGDAHILGVLTSVAGFGALMGALYLASRKSVRGLGQYIAISSGLAGLGLIFFALSHALWFSLVTIFVVAFGFMIQLASSNTVIQTVVDEDKHGRVLSLYILALMGMSPFGNLLAGWLAYKIGAGNTLIIGGISCITGAFLFAIKLPEFREKIRPIYIKKGIIPEVAKGIQEAEKAAELTQD